MPWVRFTSDFDFSPAALGGRYTKAYKAGTVDNVTRECADLALAAKKAVRTVRPKERGDDDDQDGRGRA